MRISKNILSAMLAMFVLSACSPETSARPDFRPALDAHLAAIAARDINAYQSTITDGEGLYLIFPDGGALPTREKVVGFHTDWFADPNWVLEPEIANIIEGVDMATALLKYDYRDTPEGVPRSAWLLLVFKLEGGEWRLVHDQNTRIKQSTETETE